MKIQLTSQLLASAALLGLAAGALAQSPEPGGTGSGIGQQPAQQPPRPGQPGAAPQQIPDGIVMRDNAVFFYKYGQPQRVDHELRLSEGIRADEDGNVTLKDGTKVKLRNGQMVTLEGRVTDVPGAMGGAGGGGGTKGGTGGGATGGGTGGGATGGGAGGR